MRVLVVGGGGREHALCWAIAGSPLLTRLWCAPGNPGTAEFAENAAVAGDDVAGLVAFAREHDVDLVVPGAEAALVAGLADALAAVGIRCCGPSAAAARLEGSKAFCKEIAEAAGIPTAQWERFDDAAAARAFVRHRGAPLVIKADGLAAGKGVVVARSEAEALAAVAAFMEEGVLGVAGASVLIEECLAGAEVSVFALCDGAEAVFVGAARDHKRAHDGDQGPNTGGMGAYSPVPGFSPASAEAAMAGIIRPALGEMVRRGTPFRGVLFAGLMLTADGAKLIEFNVRFGDPECQALLPRLRSDLLAALWAACNGGLGGVTLEWSDAVCLAVVMAARGYPGVPVRLGSIGGLAAARDVGGRVFQAGTALRGGVLVCDGGRVLSVCGLGADLDEARRVAYAAVAAIDFPDGYCRWDIGL